MTRKRSWIARFLALAALVAAVVAIVVVASSTDLHSNSDHKDGHKAKVQKERQPKKRRTKAKTYEVQSGDTLISIAHKTGLTLAELQALNPEVDPQTLIAGEVLKLRK
ncbi:MAG TPA: LysM domain-containing protein [Solirubrobacterales bacterium]|nr:LysM domain-containing protein [Solirubrobacterales bacterium]